MLLLGVWIDVNSCVFKYLIIYMYFYEFHYGKLVDLHGSFEIFVATTIKVSLKLFRKIFREIFCEILYNLSRGFFVVGSLGYIAVQNFADH